MGAATAGQPSAASNGDYDSSDDPSASPDDDDTQDENTPDGGSQNSDGGSEAPASHDPSGTGEIMDAGARVDGDAGDRESPVDVTAEEQGWDEAMNLARAEGKLPRRGRGDGAKRPCQHPRLADPPAPPHDRRRAPRL